MRKKWQNKNTVSGQSIIEVVIALALMVLVVLGLVKVTVSSINNSAFARDQQTATKYAQESLESARKCKEKNEAAFWENPDSLCPVLPEISNPKFEREITYTDESGPDGLKMHVEVTVSWSDSRGVHQSKLETYLSK
jgi:Tfp pilus assembly protein PilV